MNSPTLQVQTLLFPLRLTIAERFRRFHQANPGIYRALLRLAYQAQASVSRTGRPRRVGIRLLWERLRWELEVESDEDLPRFNDHYAPRYARLMVEDHPELSGLFEFRELRSP